MGSVRRFSHFAQISLGYRGYRAAKAGYLQQVQKQLRSEMLRLQHSFADNLRLYTAVGPV
jgi:hypothetical protein